MLYVENQTDFLDVFFVSLTSYTIDEDHSSQKKMAKQMLPLHIINMFCIFFLNDILDAPHF